MSNNIAYQNKDITQKVFADKFKGKSLKVYGLDIPNIKRVIPTNLPEFSANELRIDNLFLLEDDTIAIIDYESAYKKENKLKYLEYVTRVLKRYADEGQFDIKIKMIVIYTADVLPKQVTDEYDVGALRLEIESAFLSQLDSEEIMKRLTKKVESGEILSDEELMEFIILPLTYKSPERKKQALKKAIDLAKNVKDEDHMVFILSGIVVFSDKIIDDETSLDVRRWISMTKVGKLFEEEKLEYADEKVSEMSEIIVKRMLKDGFKVSEIKKYVDLSLADIKQIQTAMNLN